MLQTQNFIILPGPTTHQHPTYPIEKQKYPDKLEHLALSKIQRLLANAGINVVVKGGTMTYTADLTSGLVQYQAELTIGILFFTKTLNVSDHQSVDPDSFLSTSFNTVGNQIIAENATFTVSAVNVGSSTVTILTQNQTLTGTAVVNTASQYITVATADVVVDVHGFTVSLILKATPPK